MKLSFTLFAFIFCTAIFGQAGSLDPSFGSAGVYKSSDQLFNGYNDFVNVVKVLPNGKILLAGSGNTFVASGTNDFSVLRLNANGTRDSSFGVNGRVFIDFTVSTDVVPTDDVVNSMAIQADGKIVIAGTLGIRNNVPDSNNIINYNDIGVARLTVNGGIDSSFNGTGKKRINLEGYTHTNISYDFCTGVAVRNNGKIVLGGYTYNDNSVKNSFTVDYDIAVLQLNGNGSFDNSFNGTGVKIYPKPNTDEFISGIALQPNGKLLLVGNTGIARVATDNNFLLSRINQNGSFDNTFSGVGYVITDILNQSSDYGSSVVLLPNGKIVGSGYVNKSGIFSNYLLKYNSNGKKDPTFGTGGKVIVDSNSQSRASSLSIGSDGKIIQTTDNNTVYRYLPNGVKDSSFGVNGKVVLPIDNGACYASDIQPDGKIIVAGTAGFSLGRLGGGFTEEAARVLGSGQNLIAGMSSNKLTTGNQLALTTSALGLSVFPNPTKSYFVVRISSSDVTSKITIRVTDFSGKVIEVFSNLRAGEAKQFGGSYATGTYIAELIQGNTRKTATLIKL